MKVDKLPPIKSTLQPSNHPYLNGAWTPLMEEVDATDLEVIEGAIPDDIDGIYLRNTENQIHQPLGRHHPFDGDGMIHQISFQNGKANYRNRFVKTRCFDAEQSAEQSLWGGLMDGPGTSLRPGFGAHGSLKDSSSTDIVVHAGKAISTFYQCGEGYVLNPETLEPEGLAPWVPIDGISAHPRVDENTGEMMFFNYSKFAPYMHYGVVDKDHKLVHYVPIELPGPRLPHDMTFSENWSILNDLPVFWDEELLKRNIHAVRFHDDMPSRFALIPRHGDPSEIRWFEAAPTYVLHWLNAYEEGDEVIMDGYFQEDPSPPPIAEAGEHGHLMAYLDEHSFKSRLHRWRFNLKDGTTTEEQLDDRIVEFGMINQQYSGRKYRYVYSTFAKPGWFLFCGFIKHDLETGESETVTLDDGRYASEAPFAPRVNSQSEDDGYLVSFIMDENSGTSECILIDAKNFEAGPVCRIKLPHKICSGTHSTWVSRDKL
ncbi:carotenoid oxygenase family protein [Parasphingorhabdus flavimaris]|uniref:Dioxygenase n=2 Tax=Parasphingorhabdus flavimaris TaxID=266812 RepID=A0ABX2N393_9SPHN|nr:carotenoid oxygenase family protein [Parasphingorhabdus flavimaris]